MSTPPGSPRPEVLAILADIKDSPHHDGLRLILADWLEENGGGPLDQARADLIRSQIALVQLPPQAPERDEHVRTARSLQQRHGKEWLGPVLPWVPAWAHRRGLLTVNATVSSLRSRNMANVAATEAWAWVEEVYVTGAFDNDIAGLRQSPLLATLTGLGFQRGELGPPGAQALAGLPWLSRLARIDLSHQPITDRGLRALLASQHLERLRELEVASAGLDVAAGSALASCEWAAGLQRLVLWGNHFGGAALRALLGPGTLPRLASLDLRRNGIEDAGARVLADLPAASTLRELNLGDNQIGPVGAIALARSAHLEGIESLVLWGNPVGASGAAALRERFGQRVHVSPAG